MTVKLLLENGNIKEYKTIKVSKSNESYTHTTACGFYHYGNRYDYSGDGCEHLKCAIAKYTEPYYPTKENLFFLLLIGGIFILMVGVFSSPFFYMGSLMMLSAFISLAIPGHEDVHQVPRNELIEFRDHQTIGGLKAEQIFHHCTREDEPRPCEGHHDPEFEVKSLNNAKFVCNSLDRLIEKNEIRRYVSDHSPERFSVAVSIIVFVIIAWENLNGGASDISDIIVIIMSLPFWVFIIFIFVWFPTQLLAQKYYEGKYRREQIEKKYKDIDLSISFDRLLNYRPRRSQIICYVFFFCFFLILSLISGGHPYFTRIIFYSFVCALIFWNLANLIYKKYIISAQKQEKRS